MSAQVGQALTTTTGTWAGGGSIAYAYQWKSAGSNVGTNQNTYVPVIGDIGKTIKVVVTATNAAGSASATSLATSAVIAAGSVHLGAGAGSYAITGIAATLTLTTVGVIAAAAGSYSLSGTATVLTLSSADSWPDATTTGPTGTLTASGSITSSANGQIIQGKAVNGFILVNHNNVTVRNCSVVNDCIMVHGHDCIIEDCLATHPQPGASSAIQTEGADRCTIRRCEMSVCENGVLIGTGTGHVIRDNWVHNQIPYDPVTDPHVDGLQTFPITNSLIEHNNVESNYDASGGIAIGGATTGCTNVTINNNRVVGGQYNIRVVGPTGTGNVVTNNRVTGAAFGYFVFEGSVTYSGNVDDVTDAPALP